MTDQPYILAIDQGTTSSRAILFDREGRPAALDQREFTQYFPGDGWVEHDPEEIWRTTLEVIRGALAKADAGPRDVAAIGIANQRETTVLWERESGRAIHNAIVWQDRRTAASCAELVADGHGPMVQSKTGL
ncbi:MAG: glycerol kinase, partial [Proteobacteria bacterium]|nr:glycerol kinase [Pseudomonadota bacterium]